jgi:hypothetical protein
MLFCALFGTPYEHQPLVPSLHSRNGATADFTGKNDTWYTLLRTPCVDFAARTMATTLLMPRPQLVHTTLPTQVSWIVRPKGGGQCGVTANASALAFEVACEGDRPARFSGAWKEYKTQDFKAYMRASILNVKACGWEMNATRHETRTQVSGHAPWRYDLTLRPLALDAGQSRAKGMLAEAWLGESPGQHDDYGQRVDGFRYDVVTTSSEAQGLLAHPREAYESPGAPEPPQRTQPGSRAKEGEVIGWY